MRLRRPASLALLVLATTSAWTTALAQTPGDPIGAAIASPPPAEPETMDEDQAEAAPPPPAAPVTPQSVGPTGPPPAPYTPLAPSPYNPLGGIYARPPLSYGRGPVDTSGTPVHIDDAKRTPDRPLTNTDLNYDARLRASSASAQGMLGPLNGGWRLAVSGKGDLYALELVDRGGLLEGAWRDLHRTGINASGFIDDIQRLGSTLTVRFQTARGTALATLTTEGDGRWTGEFVDGDDRKAATLRRD